MINAREIAGRLTTIESLAIIPRVASTNLIARRIVNECIENELSLPQAMIIAREQFAGRGRNQRSWSSPPGKGIYATTLLMRTTEELPLLPLAIANLVAGYLQDTFSLEARIKWPNDILVGGRKIAGILMEARVSETRAFVVIGIGINAEPVQDDIRPNAVSIREVAGSKYVTVDSATVDFVHYIDRGVARPFIASDVLAKWRALTIHKDGDLINSVIGENTVEGRWAGIDDHGRALLTKSNGDTVAVSSGDLLL
jgi:BirA family biotin operon repressor/biotin-[acetyl-CoA-carboxylase] ligase